MTLTPLSTILRYMEKKILNYRILIEPDQRTGTSAECFSVYCPTLGLADSGDSIEDAIQNMKRLIQFHLESLAKEKEEIPEEQIDKSVVATVQVPYPHLA